MDITIHINPTQPHQIEHGQWFKRGLERHGLKLDITSDIRKPADIHIVSGNHYARDYWIGHPNTIWLDKRLYKEGSKSNGMYSDPYVSLGWLNDKGSRNFVLGENKESVKTKELKTGDRTIFLVDYMGVVGEADTIRYHPAQKTERESLIDALARHDIAIGYTSTALITAAIEGLQIDCRDPDYILNNPNWREILPYADWHYSEIESGEAWEHLCQ